MKLLWESLKQQPAAVRRNVAFGTALSVTLVIGLIWTTTLPARFSSITDVVTDVAQSEEQDDGFRALFGTAKDQLGSAVAALRGANDFDDVYIPESAEAPVAAADTVPVVATTTQEIVITQPPRVLIATTTQRATVPSDEAITSE